MQMNKASNITISFTQLPDIIKKLAVKQKIILFRELKKEARQLKLEELHTAFKIDELPDELINEEVALVRMEMYDLAN